MGRLRLRQGPSQLRLAGRSSLRSSLFGLILGLALLCAAPSAANADADLTLTKTDSPDPVLAGQLLTYTLTVENKGPDEATGVQIVDAVPAGVMFESSASSPACVESPPGTVTCDLGAITSGTTSAAEIKVRPPTSGTITNQATVTSTVTDPNTGDNSQSASTIVSPADLRLTQVDSPDPVTVGELLTYTLTVHNSGPESANGVKVADTLPSGLIPDSGASSPGCAESPAGTVTCDLGSIASGADASVDIKVRPQSEGSVTNQASVSYDVPDPNPGDNLASADTTINAAPLAPPPLSAPPPKANTLNVVIFGSVVLISGRSVKLVKGRLVPVIITCAGQRKCAGRLTITSDKPLKKPRQSKKGKRVERLGSTSFAIDGNRHAKVMVRLSRRKARLVKQLRRVKARATIREVDVGGHPRISTRTFLLRAR
jgi:uncharacterized repeat protein (TIGR01451 family)